MLKINYNLIDYDDEAQYVVQVKVADEKSASSTVTVTVNINGNVRVFVEQLLTFHTNVNACCRVW
jgi:cellulase/cellobiase CelA1